MYKNRKLENWRLRIDKAKVLIEQDRDNNSGFVVWGLMGRCS